MVTLIEFDTFILHISDRRNKQFYDIRRYSISPSKFYNLSGENQFTNLNDELEIILGDKKRYFTTTQLSNMSRGRTDENDILKEYINRTGNNLFKFDKEYAIWKEDLSIRGIPDSLVTFDKVVDVNDLKNNIIGVVECKSKNKYDGNASLYDYYQMLGYMTIFGVSWCDYVVKNLEKDEITIQRIDYNKDHWDKLYSKLSCFRDKLLESLKERGLYDKFMNINQN